MMKHLALTRTTCEVRDSDDTRETETETIRTRQKRHDSCLCYLLCLCVVIGDYFSFSSLSSFNSTCVCVFC